jgi:hypothetical protein
MHHDPEDCASTEDPYSLLMLNAVFAPPYGRAGLILTLQ